MAKKIVLGIVIAIILSLTAYGAVYAYQREKVKLEGSGQGRSHRGGIEEYSETESVGDEKCPRYEYSQDWECPYEENISMGYGRYLYEEKSRWGYEEESNYCWQQQYEEKNQYFPDRCNSYVYRDWNGGSNRHGRSMR